MLIITVVSLLITWTNRIPSAGVYFVDLNKKIFTYENLMFDHLKLFILIYYDCVREMVTSFIRYLFK